MFKSEFSWILDFEKKNVKILVIAFLKKTGEKIYVER